MDIFLHNTLTGQKERFVPLNPERITMYVCGPTVYNYVHIGNGRPAVVFDVLTRLLRTQYPQVVYARNVTDIDDKINAAAAQNNEPISALADRYTQAYDEDIAALGVLPATVEPRATGHIDEIIAMITTLIDRGHAYAADGHVLFHVPSDPDYGKLARRTLEDMLDGARVDVAPYKRDAKDFVLWKPSTPELPGWESPWGRGRPGWHIECSAMIERHLGAVIDIHGGGSDLTFPHHENESAQSRCAHGLPSTVRYWLHNGMLTMGAEKMSKSLGNIVTIHALREQHPGELLRYALLMGQYRSSLAWGEDNLVSAGAALDRLYQALRAHPGDDRPVAYSNGNNWPEAVIGALADDLNTPEALAAMHALATEMNRTEDAARRDALRKQMLAGGWLLGILNEDPENWFKRGAVANDADWDEDWIEAQIQARADAKAQRDFAEADAIRAALLERGIELEDTREGTRWRRR